MKFELTPELVDQIIFGMENQEQEFFFDTHTYSLVPIGEVDEDPEDLERYVLLPPWQSVHGFNLMERFVLSLRNPIYREMLRQILSSGRGVFRQFKNALKERSDIERLWYGFKEREMKKEVYAWYNAMREAWGLKEIEMDFEDTSDLVLSDFIIEEWRNPNIELIENYDKAGFFEMFPGESLCEETKEGLHRSRRYGNRPDSEGSLVYKATTPGGELAGFLWAVRNSFRTDLATLHIMQIFILPEYRGLGLANSLLEKFCAETVTQDFRRVTIELMGEALGLNDAFQKKGFAPFSEVLELDLREWEKKSSSLG